MAAQCLWEVTGLYIQAGGQLASLFSTEGPMPSPGTSRDLNWLPCLLGTPCYLSRTLGLDPPTFLTLQDRDEVP